MQIHELPTLPSSDGSEYMAVDTGSATYKMKTLFGAISSTVLKIFGSLVVNGTLGTGGKTAYNDTTNSGVWLTNNGVIHLSQDTTHGGAIGFHYNHSANSTTSITENASGVLHCTGRFESNDWTGTIRTGVSSISGDGLKVGYLKGTTATNLVVCAQWGTEGGNFVEKNVTVSASDARLKENVADCNVDALDIINSIPMRQFDWIETGEHQNIGMVADELDSIDNRLTVGGETGEDGTINYKSIDTFYLVGYLVKAVQELSAEVERLRG